MNGAMSNEAGYWVVRDPAGIILYCLVTQCEAMEVCQRMTVSSQTSPGGNRAGPTERLGPPIGATDAPSPASS